MSFLFWVWIGGALGQAAFASWQRCAMQQIRHNYHCRGWPTLIGHLLSLALWPLLAIIFLVFERRITRQLDHLDGARFHPVQCEVCGFEDEFRVVRGNWLQDPPYWYGYLKDEGITVCSAECTKRWEEHHMKEHKRSRT